MVTNMEKWKTLKLYIIKSHMDKPMERPAEYASIFDCMIQAGAALTEKRVCEINDHDGFADSISDRNRRYCEASAMYWIWKHIDTDYVGVTHYRRRLDISDDRLKECMRGDVDIITSIPLECGQSLKQGYSQTHYAWDWKLFIDIMGRLHPEDIQLAEEVFDGNLFHPCNINIFKAAVYDDYCAWMYPVLNEFYEKSAEKTDTYQHRDVGFIAERMTSLYIVKKKREGLNVKSVKVIELRSDPWTPEKECDLLNPAEVYAACSRLYEKNRITDLSFLLLAAREQDTYGDVRLDDLEDVLLAGIEERWQLKCTFYEYLPYELRSTLDTLIQIYKAFEKSIRVYCEIGNEESYEILLDFLKLTGFSDIVIKRICSRNEIKKEMTEEILRINYKERS